MKMNLYQLSANYQRLMDKVMASDELSPEFMDELGLANDSLENKILNYASVVKSLESHAKSIMDRANEMADRALVLQNRIEPIKQKMLNEMMACNKDKFENEYHVVTTRLNNPKVHYDDIKMLPPRFIKEKITTIEAPDKALILKELKEGKHVPGCSMIRNTRLEIK